MCEESRKHVGKHLPLTVIEHLKTGFGGEMLAKHAILMTEYLPTIPTVVDKEPQWLRENIPKSFTGTVYTDGTTSINHVFPQARRSGVGAVMIADQLPDSDQEPGTDIDDEYVPEEEQHTDQLGQVRQNHTSKDQVIFTHGSKRWPVTVNDLGDITRVDDFTLKR